jgi:hypothetical protein
MTDDEQIHAMALKRNKAYPRVKAMPKWFRFRQSWPRQNEERESVRDEHAAVLVRKTYIGRFV